jgi:hypothetical protein
MYQTGLLGAADCLFKLPICKAEVAADAFSPPPGMRAGDTEAMELGDERRRAFETVSVHAGDIGVAQRDTTLERWARAL